MPPIVFSAGSRLHNQNSNMSRFRFRPLFDRVLIRKLLPAEKTIGGIVLPEKAQQKVNQGLIVSVGPGSYDSTGRLRATIVKEGDRVYLSDYGGHEIEVNDEKLHVFREEDILGILEDDGKGKKGK